MHPRLRQIRLTVTSNLERLLLLHAAVQGCFPEPDKDPVIQIASMVTNQGESGPVVRNVMTLDTCAAIIGSEVMSFKTEEELLKVGLL